MNVYELKSPSHVGTLLSFAVQSYDAIAASIKETLLHNQEQSQSVQEVETTNFMPITEIDVNNERKQLRNPVLLEVAREAEVYIAENKALNVVASGDTSDEAIADAKNTIANEFSFYAKTSEDKLVGMGLALKKVYANLFD